MSVAPSLLVVLPRLSGGGAERVSLNLISRLRARHQSVELLVFDRSGSLAVTLADEVPLHNLATISLRRSFFSLIKKLRILRPKVVFSPLGYVTLALLLISPPCLQELLSGFGRQICPPLVCPTTPIHG